MHYLRSDPKRFLMVYAWSMAWFLAILASEVTVGDYPANYLIDLALIIGLVFLGAGWFSYKTKNGHLATILGWQAFGIYWTFQCSNYVVLHPDDPINVIMYGPALALFSVFCIHEWDMYKGAKPNRALKFMAGMTFVGAGTYFAFAKITQLSVVLIWSVAAQTSWLYNLTGAVTSVSGWGLDPLNGEVAVPIFGSGISIILACTGIEAIVIFLGAFVCIEPEKNPWKAFKKITPRMKSYMKMSPRERRFRALMYTIPPIWVLNLVRNVSIIYLVESEIMDFPTAHGYLGKSFSFLVLLGLAMIVFDLVPEIYDDLTALYRLGKPEKKKKGGPVKDGPETGNEKKEPARKKETEKNAGTEKKKPVKGEKKEPRGMEKEKTETKENDIKKDEKNKDETKKYDKNKDGTNKDDKSKDDKARDGRKEEE